MEQREISGLGQGSTDLGEYEQISTRPMTPVHPPPSCDWTGVFGVILPVIFPAIRVLRCMYRTPRSIRLYSGGWLVKSAW